VADQFVGEIRIVGFNFAPQGWAFCSGQLLPIAQNSVLFSLLGTNYGGNGITTFALPNLRGAAPLHRGQGIGLTSRVVGERGGSAAVSLSEIELPTHSHGAVVGCDSNGTQQSPVNGRWAKVAGVARQTQNAYSNNFDGQTSAQAFLASGNGQPHNNMPPYLVLRFCIALQGRIPTP
jgi:microcystin-dependent protein